MNPNDFKLGMRRLAAGVSLITTVHDGVRHGLVATAVNSVTADPPTLLVCINKSASAHDHVDQAGVLCVNILAHEHEAVAARFSSPWTGRSASIPGTGAASPQARRRSPIASCRSTARSGRWCPTSRTRSSSRRSSGGGLGGGDQPLALSRRQVSQPRGATARAALCHRLTGRHFLVLAPRIKAGALCSGFCFFVRPPAIAGLECAGCRPNLALGFL